MEGHTATKYEFGIFNLCNLCSKDQTITVLKQWHPQKRLRHLWERRCVRTQARSLGHGNVGVLSVST